MSHHGAIYVATHTCVLWLDGKQIVLRKGVTRVREGHELLKKHKELFKVIDCHFEVEEARAKPGRPRHAGPKPSDFAARPESEREDD